MADQTLRSQASNNWRSRDDTSRSQSPATGYSQTPARDRREPAGGQWQERTPRGQFWGSPRSNDTSSKSHSNKQPSETLVESSDALEEEEIQEALKDNGFPEIDQIHISIDPMTGRNPGYCFVEFLKRPHAERAIEKMKGVTIRGRPLKTGRCQPKGRERKWITEEHKPLFSRWGNWDPEGGNVRVDGQGPTGAEEHLTDVVRNWKDNHFRVYVGGLWKMINQTHNDRELREIFDGFNVVALSKRITTQEETRLLPGKRNYAFVDLESKTDAERAIEKLNGTMWQCGRLKVRVPMELPQKVEDRAWPLQKEEGEGLEG